MYVGTHETIYEDIRFADVVDSRSCIKLIISYSTETEEKDLKNKIFQNIRISVVRKFLRRFKKRIKKERRRL